jgi:hypothetical protein
MKETLEKPEGTIKNGHCRETDIIGYTGHRTKINKTKRKRQTLINSHRVSNFGSDHNINLNCIKKTKKTWIVKNSLKIPKE